MKGNINSGHPKSFFNVRYCSLTMGWGFGKLERGTEIFGVLGWGEPLFAGHVDGGAD